MPPNLFATRAIDRWVHDAQLAGDHHDQVGARLLLFGAVFGLPVWLLMASFHVWYAGQLTLGLVIGFCGILVANVPTVLRWTKSVEFTAHYALALLYLALLAIGWQRGGFIISVQLWYGVIPIGCMLLGLPRIALRWGFAIAAQAIVLLTLDVLDLITPSSPPGSVLYDQVQIAALITVVSGLLLYFHRAERQLAQQVRQLTSDLRASKLESLGEIASGVAHDFNNVLTIIMSSARMAQLAEDDEQIREDLNAILLAADRGAAMTRRLLMFSRDDSGFVEIVPVHEVVDAVVVLLRPVLPDTVRLTARYGRGSPHVAVDRCRLEQVVVNLCINARDALVESGGGGLEIRVSKQVLTEPLSGPGRTIPAGEYIRLEVADDGPGIPPDVLPRIFDPFYTTKEARKGTGLGLSTAFAFARSAGGLLDVTSTVGFGAQFRIWLPAVPAPQAAAAQFATKTGELKRLADLSILVVDDDESVRSALCAMLEPQHKSVECIGGGAAALDRAISNEFDVILTDLRMPEMTGIELERELSRHAPASTVLFMTGCSDSFSELPIGRRLRKPFSAEQLALILTAD